MAIKTLRRNTSARRNMSVNDFSELTKNSQAKKSVKSLKLARKQNAGRNNQGKITVRHRGGGAKRAIRVVDFDFREVDGARVVAIEYDPNRSANLALVELADGSNRYLLATSGLKVGAQISSAQKAPVKAGNRLALSAIPVGSTICNIELNLGRGGTLVRSAGAKAQLVAKDGNYVQVKLPSGEVRKIHHSAYATLGAVGNEAHQNIKLGSAGRRRHMGFRPTVRGKAMNPVDHPHGGGEAANSIGMDYPKTPWGKHALGKKTRRRKSSNAMIIRSRKKGR